MTAPISLSVIEKMAINDLEDLEKLTVLKAQMDSFSIKDLCAGQFPTVGEDDTVSDVLGAMRKSGFQEIPVVSGGNYVGMVKYSTLLRKKSAIPSTKVKAVMTNLPTLTCISGVTEIAEIMVKENCRQLAVLDGKKIVDVVTRNKIVGIASKMKALKDYKVWEIMTSPVVTAKETEMLSEAVETMIDLDIRTLPIIDRLGNLSGVLGMKEVIENSWKAGERSVSTLNKNPSNQIPVSTIAVTNVLTVDWEDSIAQVAAIMADKNISTLPVMDGEDIMAYNPLLLVKDFGASGEIRTDNTFMTNADVPTLAMADLIRDPVNPFTEKPIDGNVSKQEKQYITMSHDWDTDYNNGNVFFPATWYTVQDNALDVNNWENAGVQ